jgi:pyruvate dehydrogenase E2 component (dihydrolipoamide acetyltransferase)
MSTIIEMPKLSDTMTVGTVVKWHKKAGDRVSNGDILAEIETDKATMELENFDDGTLLKIFVEEGEEADIGSALAVVGEEGEVIPEIPTGNDNKDQSDDSEAESDEEHIEPILPEQKTEPNLQENRIRVSPLAKKIALKNNIDLSQIVGSGPQGRIIKADVENFLSPNSTPLEQSVAKNTPSSTNLRKLPGKKVPLTNIRSIIATRLLESKTSIPHFYLQREINALPLRLAREAINNKLATHAKDNNGARVSLNDIILKACSESIFAVPEINTSWGEKEIIFHEDINLSFGVAVEDGLLTPVIREAQNLDLLGISVYAKSLIEKARSKKLKPDEMSGSTFTVTNLGMFGIDFFSGIINPPNAAILSIGTSVKKPVVAQDGSIQPGETMTIGLSCDHRLIDGAVGAQFLSVLAANLENPALMLV